jgi:NAD(P)-dependent dehydrogenase (short-subunit alcohol dehydrogenase family)
MVLLMTIATPPRDPKELYPQPPLPKQPQEFPGIEKAMHPKPDYGLESYQGSNKLLDRAALITGGDSGIGRAVALAFAREGADVVISYLEVEEKDAQETVHAVQASGRKAVAVPGNIQDEDYCIQLVKRTVQEFGKIDVLVNNAALQKSFESLLDIPSADFEAIFRTNMFATFYLCKAAVPHMPEGSSIINTASVVAYQPHPPLLAYAASKGAIVTFTKGLAQELIEKGIRVNAVAPGPIWTPLNMHGGPPERIPHFGENTPLGRAGQPVEVAPIFVLLASQEGSYITGEVYGVTGGRGLL